MTIMKTCLAVEEYLHYLKDSRHRSPNTIESYQNDLRQYCEFLCNLSQKLHPFETSGLSMLPGPDLPARIVQAMPPTAQAFCEFLKAKFYAPATIARKCAAAEGFYKYLRKIGQIKQNPFEDFQFVKPKPSGRVCLEEPQIAKLLSAVPNNSWLGIRDKAVVALLYTTGIKVGELSQLTLADYSANEKNLHIRKRGGRTRIVSVPDRAEAVIQEYLSVRRLKSEECTPPTEILFLNRDCGPLTVRSIRRKLKQYSKDAGFTVGVTPETLRRSHVIQMLRRGVPPEQLAWRLGYFSVAALKQQMEFNEAAYPMTDEK